MEQAIRSARLSRWGDDPILDARGQPIAIEEHELRPGDLRCFELLARFRYLRTAFITALVGGNAKHRQRRLALLARQPNKYLHRPRAQRRAYNANYRDQIYQLAKRGERVLRTRGFNLAVHRLGDELLFEHSMMVSDTLASLLLGVWPGRIAWWDELRTHPNFPSGGPDAIRVCIRHPTETGLQSADFEYRNDSDGVFAIVHPGRPYAFFSLEAERTNRVYCGTGLGQASFLRKFLAIQNIMEAGLHKICWRIPNMTHLVVAPSQARIETMKRLILQLTDGTGVPHTLFREVPIMSDIDRTCRPMPELYTAPWQRAGYPDISLDALRVECGASLRF